jgi:GlpG protein
MRQVGHLPDEASAHAFIDWLLVQGVSAKAEADGPVWTVWVHDEDQLAKAAGELKQYLANPSDPRYRSAGQEAEQKRREEHGRNDRLRANQVDMSRRWGKGAPGGAAGGIQAGPVMLGLLGICLLVAVLTEFGADRKSPILAFLHFADRSALLELMQLEGKKGADLGRIMELAEKLKQATIWDGVLSGQVWRLVTPIFMHFSIMHLVFNGWAFLDFGGQIERQKGGLFLLLLVLITGIASNLVQAAGDSLWNGPMLLQNGGFGGLSGVVYATIGFVWMRSKFGPEHGFYMRQETVFLSMFWLAYCIYNNLNVGAGQVHYANGAHVGGLLAGMLWGYWPRLWR